MTYNQKIPPFKWFILENFPYIEEDFDALTNWQLFCKLGKEMNKIIEKTNLTGEQVEQLTTAFNELKAYIDDYFENLDLQDEVNTKLDEMAESGDLADIIAQYVNIQSVLAYDDKADMKSAENLVSGSICRTLGDLSYNDGKGALYKIREVLTTDVIDDENIIAIHNPELIAEKIPYSKNYDFEIKIENIEDKIKNYTQNSKYMAPLFVDTTERQSIEYVTTFLTNCANAGFKECQMIIHINNDGTIDEDSTKFEQYDNIANSLNIPITSIKFHGSYDSTNYLQTIIDIIGMFENIQSCFIFNEQLANCLNYGLTYPATIKATYPNIKVGFTCQYNSIYQTPFTLENWESLISNYDILGVHLYPSCSSYSNAKNCSFDKVLNAFNSPEFIIPWTKEIWITESGVLPYWQFLELPEGYNLALLTDTTKTTEPQRIFFNALDKCDLAQKSIKICPWFLESGMHENTQNLFTDIFKNIILKR